MRDEIKDEKRLSGLESSAVHLTLCSLLKRSAQRWSNRRRFSSSPWLLQLIFHGVSPRFISLDHDAQVFVFKVLLKAHDFFPQAYDIPFHEPIGFTKLCVLWISFKEHRDYVFDTHGKQCLALDSWSLVCCIMGNEPILAHFLLHPSFVQGPPDDNVFAVFVPRSDQVVLVNVIFFFFFCI